MNRRNRGNTGASVLVVDDEPGVLEGITLLLELEGFRVAQASDGRQALDRLSQTPCDLVVTDLMMPDMDGAELIDAIRERDDWKGIPIILTSTALAPGSGIPGKADAFLHRPFEIGRLVGIINLLLERQARDG